MDKDRRLLVYFQGLICTDRKEGTAVAGKLTVGLAAHVDAGKTTLSESMLFLSRALRSCQMVRELLHARVF